VCKIGNQNGKCVKKQEWREGTQGKGRAEREEAELGHQRGEGVRRNIPHCRDAHGAGDESVRQFGHGVCRDGVEHALDLIEVTIFAAEFRSREAVHS
jgi:hypothetical protein